MQALTSFRELALRFRSVWFDSYGVLRDHVAAIPGGPETVAELHAAGVDVRVLTNNAARSQAGQAARLAEFGYAGIRPEHVVTSGLTAKLFLREKIAGGRVGYLGTADAARYVLDAGCEPVPIGEVGDPLDLAAVVFLDDEGYDWNTDINAAINVIRSRPLPVIVANSDRLYPVHDGRVALATGGIAQVIESVVGRRFLHFGKPDATMFQLALDDLQRETLVQRREVLMVGDTLHTDILGGNKFGVQTCLVFTGNTRAEEYAVTVARTGVVPDYVCAGIGT